MTDESSGFPRGGETPDSATQVASEILCMSCGYNLHLIPKAGQCPGCGVPVARSLHGDTLDFADPAWVRSLRMALSWSLSYAGSIVLLVILVLFLVTARASLPSYFALIPATIDLVSIWLLTAPDPRARTAERSTSLRFILRALAISNCANEALGFANRVAPNVTVFWTLRVLDFCGIASVWCYYRYLSLLARRLPSRSMSRQCAVIAWGISLPSFLLEILAQTQSIFHVRLTSTAGGLAVEVPSMLALALFIPWALIVLIRLRIQVGRAARAALVHSGRHQAPA